MANSIMLLVIGSGLTILGSIINLICNYIATGIRADKDRKENFNWKINELRLEAAQKAYQYVFVIHRTCGRKKLTQELADEARNWLDGQAIILGEEIHRAVYSYFNYASMLHDTLEYTTAMDRAIKELNSVIKQK